MIKSWVTDAWAEGSWNWDSWIEYIETAAEVLRYVRMDDESVRLNTAAVISSDILKFTRLDDAASKQNTSPAIDNTVLKYIRH